MEAGSSGSPPVTTPPGTPTRARCPSVQPVGSRVVVIGGDAAGGSAASQAKKRRPDLDVVMFERGRATSYSACGIPYWISGAVPDEASLIARTPDQHRAAGIDVRIRTEVVGIDLDRRGGGRGGPDGGPPGGGAVGAGVV